MKKLFKLILLLFVYLFKSDINTSEISKFPSKAAQIAADAALARQLAQGKDSKAVQMAQDEALARKLAGMSVAGLGHGKEKKEAAEKAVNIKRMIVGVTQQTGDDCGFHAIYNAAHDEKLTREYLEIMRSMCINKHSLQPEDIFMFATKEFRMKPETFSILPNVNQLVPREDGYIDSDYLLAILGSNGILSPLYRKVGLTNGIEILANAINNLRTKNGSKHDFIIGNSKINYDPLLNKYTPDDTGAHWITIKARNEHGIIIITIKDSQSGNKGTPKMIENLEKILRNTNTAALARQASKKLTIN